MLLRERKVFLRIGNVLRICEALARPCGSSSSELRANRENAFIRSVIKNTGVCFVCSISFKVMAYDSVLLSWYLWRKQDDRFGEMTCLDAVNMSSDDNMPLHAPLCHQSEHYNHLTDTKRSLQPARQHCKLTSSSSSGFSLLDIDIFKYRIGE